MKRESLSKAVKEFLESKGWESIYHDNYWVNREVMAGANLDHCGVDLTNAFKIQLERQKRTTTTKGN